MRLGVLSLVLLRGRRSLLGLHATRLRYWGLLDGTLRLADGGSAGDSAGA